jgi:hypothetical protein
MDPVTTAILTAVGAKTTELATVEAFKVLKKILKRKFGTKSRIVDAVSALETNPDSPARKQVVQEEVTAAKADQDPELIRAAQTLLNKLNIKQVTGNSSQTARGDHNIQVAGDENTINVNVPKSRS